MAKAIGVPTVQNMKHAFGKFGWGAVGGLIFLIAYRLFGAFGLIAAPIIAGSVMKGDNGEDLAFMSGFLLLAMGAFSGGGVGASDNQSSGGQAV